jgi:sugar/nucleoside kinase (ribokinase family)
MNNRRTLKTELGVFESFQPELPAAWRDTPFVLLANIAPALQHHVLDQMRRPRFVIADTMDLWLNIALPDLLRLLRRIDALVLNDHEARQLAKADNLLAAAVRLHRMGPRYVIVKKGEHGSILSGPRGLFLCPAYPLPKVMDPTGAGDSFVGALIGHLAQARGAVEKNLRQAMLHGSVVASICCEGFGLERTTKTTGKEIRRRLAELKRLTQA